MIVKIDFLEEIYKQFEFNFFKKKNLYYFNIFLNKNILKNNNY
jgi:hypothetical protein